MLPKEVPGHNPLTASAVGLRWLVGIQHAVAIGIWIVGIRAIALLIEIGKPVRVRIDRAVILSQRIVARCHPTVASSTRDDVVAYAEAQGIELQDKSEVVLV